MDRQKGQGERGDKKGPLGGLREWEGGEQVDGKFWNLRRCNGRRRGDCCWEEKLITLEKTQGEKTYLGQGQENREMSQHRADSCGFQLREEKRGVAARQE